MHKISNVALHQLLSWNGRFRKLKALISSGTAILHECSVHLNSFRNNLDSGELKMININLMQISSQGFLG